MCASRESGVDGEGAASSLARAGHPAWHQAHSSHLTASSSQKGKIKVVQRGRRGCKAEDVWQGSEERALESFAPSSGLCLARQGTAWHGTARPGSQQLLLMDEDGQRAPGAVRSSTGTPSGPGAFPASHLPMDPAGREVLPHPAWGQQCHLLPPQQVIPCQAGGADTGQENSN